MKSFLDKVDEDINCKPIEKLLKRNTKRLKDLIGADPYLILAMFKSILPQRWFGLSDRDLENALYNDLKLIRFTRFSVSSEKPDHTTICR
ncbi:MAG: transposase [Deltaproteobacteria bacterium]|nr:transposase [Deltaproteobacteria bacterium]